MAKKKPIKWVRLSNGQIEDDDRIGQIVLDIRSWALNNPLHFEMVAQWLATPDDVPPDFVLAALRQKNLIKTGVDSDDDDPELYDDVRDVIECCSEWTGKRARFDTKNLLAVDQANIVPPDDE